MAKGELSKLDRIVLNGAAIALTATFIYIACWGCQIKRLEKAWNSEIDSNPQFKIYSELIDKDRNIGSFLDGLEWRKHGEDLNGEDFSEGDVIRYVVDYGFELLPEGQVRELRTTISDLVESSQTYLLEEKTHVQSEIRRLEQEEPSVSKFLEDTGIRKTQKSVER
ncbi:MAG: hypothetical protein KKH88_03110 [Nanoarchaeota archaeon]|nr:hypothetical protein [Nanoarchaeota archaeon]